MPTDDSPIDGHHRRERDNIRDLFLEAAIIEFGQNGFDGASTTAIAKRAEAFQPQINYHFKSKRGLWEAAVDQLFAELNRSLAGIDDLVDPVHGFAELIRQLVRFAANRPQLHQIIMHESSGPSDRLSWLVSTHVRGHRDLIRSRWIGLQAEGLAAPIDERSIYSVVVRAATLPFVNHPKTRTTHRPANHQRFHSSPRRRAHSNAASQAETDCDLPTSRG
ncbi:MAG: TetR/AcrR family transcriptional regulator [Acidimicrobiales bacterium]